MNSYATIIERLAAPVRQYLARELEHGVTQVTVAQVKQLLNQMGGRPTGLVTNVLEELKREGTIRDIIWAGKDGIVYLTGGEDDAATQGRCAGEQEGNQAGGAEGGEEG